MATKYGILTGLDNDFAFVSQAGREVLYRWVQAAFDAHNAERAVSKEFFVEKQTVAREMRYTAPGGGFSQVLGRQAAPEAVKRSGYWTVGFPLYSTGDQIAYNKQDEAKRTAGEMEADLITVMNRDANLERHDILSAILDNRPRTFLDQDYLANVIVEPLANGDATLYPPVIGSAAGAPDAVDNHYLTMAVLNAGNFTIFIDELLEHFDYTQGGDNAMVICNPVEGAVIAALAGFNAFADKYTNPTIAATWTQSNVPNAPGLTLGRYQGVWVNEWRQMPAGYMFATHLDFPAPLMERVYAPSELPTGLNLAAVEERYPITSWFYDHFYGFGCGNRLNGVVWQVAAAPYVVPGTVWFPYALAV